MLKCVFRHDIAEKCGDGKRCRRRGHRIESSLAYASAFWRNDESILVEEDFQCVLSHCSNPMCQFLDGEKLF